MKLSWDHASVWSLDCFKVYGRADYFMFHGLLYAFLTVRKMSLPYRFTQKTRQYFLYWTVDDLSRWSKSTRGKLSINLFSQRWNPFWKRKQNSSVSYRLRSTSDGHGAWLVFNMFMRDLQLDTIQSGKLNIVCMPTPPRASYTTVWMHLVHHPSRTK